MPRYEFTIDSTEQRLELELDSSKDARGYGKNLADEHRSLVFIKFLDQKPARREMFRPSTK